MFGVNTVVNVVQPTVGEQKVMTAALDENTTLVASGKQTTCGVESRGCREFIWVERGTPLDARERQNQMGW